MAYKETKEYIKLQQELIKVASRGWFCMGLIALGNEKYRAIINTENVNRKEYNKNHYPRIHYV